MGMENKPRRGYVARFVAAGNEKQQTLLLPVHKAAQRPQRPGAVPQHGQEERAAGPRQMQNAAVPAGEFVGAGAFALAPFPVPEADQDFDVAGVGFSAGEGESERVGLIDLAQETAHFLACVGAELALQVVLEIVGEFDIRADQQIGVVSFADARAVVLMKCRPGQRRDERVQALFGGAEILQREPPPSHLTQVRAEDRDRRLVCRMADEAGVIGPGNAARHLDFAAEAPRAVAVAHAPPQRKKSDVVPVARRGLDGQHTPVVPAFAEQLPQPAPRQEIVSVGVGGIHRVPVALAGLKHGQRVDDIQMHGV